MKNQLLINPLILLMNFLIDKNFLEYIYVHDSLCPKKKDKNKS